MSVIMRDHHQSELKRVKRRALKIHCLGVVITLLVAGFMMFRGLEVQIIKESYRAFKGQFAVLTARQQLYSLLRSKALTVGQAIDVADVILTQDRVPVTMALAMISVESDFNPKAVSKAGARGLTQVMPILQKIYAKHPAFGKEITQTHEVSVNVKLGLMYLGDMYEQFKDWRKALRAYNAGPENAMNHQYDGYANAVLLRAEEYERRLNI